MKLNICLPFLSFATLAVSRPSSEDVTIYDDPIPYGAFPSSSPSPSSPLIVAPSGIPDINPDDLSNDDASRVGRAIVYNNCPFPVYVWSVGSTIRPETTLAARGGRFTETFRRDVKTGGIALKITTVKGGLFTSSPQTIFAYNLQGNQVWYDLSDVFGDPFRGHPVSLLPSDPLIFWRNGIPPRGSQVRVQKAKRDLTLVLC